MVNPLFAKSSNQKLPPKPDQPGAPSWRVLIVDDEPEVHNVTVLALKNFKVLDSFIEYSHAYSAKEAREILDNEGDFAVAFIDVVMESDHAGLELVDYIRNSLGDNKIRLILRTGQPGQAPEQSVVEKYDINDYREKTELTSHRLKTVLFSALRSYRDIQIIDQQRKGLNKVLSSSNQVLEDSNLNNFAEVVRQGLAPILPEQQISVVCVSKPNAKLNACAYTLIADEKDTRFFENYPKDEIESGIYGDIETIFSARCSQKLVKAQGNYIADKYGYEHVVYIQFEQKITQLQQDLIDLYLANVCLVYEALIKNEDSIESQKELVYMLSEAVEQRSLETGMHVKRVAFLSELLAQLSGESAERSELIKHASPLHDLGKIAIPDNILHKPGKLDAQEWEIMQTHAQKGKDILGKTGRPILDTAAIIAGAHHEKWDGSGYPNRLSGEDIPLEGRIVAIVDVFDALGSRRSYKEPWPNEKIKSLIEEEAGRHFDPRLAQLLLDNFDKFAAIRDQYPDK